jgi:hypothetical protein
MTQHIDLFGNEILPIKSKKRSKEVVSNQTNNDYNKRDRYEDPRFFIVPSFSLHPDELYIYGRKEWLGESNTTHNNSLQNLLNNQTHGKLSRKSTQKAKRAIKYLLLQSKEKKVYNPKFRTTFNFKVNFITLTLSSQQQHTSQQIKRELLNQFFIEAKKKWNLTNYVWRAEKQQNGTIHFHILSDRFIPFNELRATWNRIQNKLGYVDRFQQKNNKKTPNSTDIHSLQKIKNVESYITKYMTKPKRINVTKIKRIDAMIKDKSTDIQQSVSNGAKQYLGRLTSNGREWACSRSLSNITGARFEYESEYKEELEKLRKKDKSKEIIKDYVSMYYFKSEVLNDKDFPLLNKLLQDYYSLIFTEPNITHIDNTGISYAVPINNQ